LSHSDQPAAVPDALSDMHIDGVFHALLLFAKPDLDAPSRIQGQQVSP
jgi:hypothetical protein